MFLGSDKFDTPKSGSVSRPALSGVPPYQAMLQPPPPQVLVIERIYSGKLATAECFAYVITFLKAKTNCLKPWNVLKSPNFFEKLHLLIS